VLKFTLNELPFSITKQLLKQVKFRLVELSHPANSSHLVDWHLSWTVHFLAVPDLQA